MNSNKPPWGIGDVTHVARTMCWRTKHWVASRGPSPFFKSMEMLNCKPHSKKENNKMSYCISKSEVVDEGASKVFRVLADIENWHLWTRSVTKIAYLEKHEFRVGAKVLVIQPKLSPAVWTITEIIPNRSFVWQTRSYGVNITAKHTLQDGGKGTFIEHQVIYEGTFAWLVYMLTARVTNRYLEMEITGLKNKCEEINGGYLQEGATRNVSSPAGLRPREMSN
jgi:hypothetical protein